MATIINKRHLHIRKPCTCYGCGEGYLTGSKMLRITGKVDGLIVVQLYCWECEDWLERHDWIDPLELEAGHIRKNTRRMSWRELDRVEGGA